MPAGTNNLPPPASADQTFLVLQHANPAPHPCPSASICGAGIPSRIRLPGIKVSDSLAPLGEAQLKIKSTNTN
jgi:hypothetical protein